MPDLTNIVRSLVKQELSALQLGDIAVVTAIFPHKEGDDNNYDCSVKLRHADIEYPRVPMLTPHIGMVSTPQVGDLVMLNYVDGDGQRPIVMGRLYSNKTKPPEHEEAEWMVQSSLPGQSSLRIDKDENVQLSTKKVQLTLTKEGEVRIESEADLNIEIKGNVNLKCADVEIDASGKINLGKDGAPVITEKSHKCYFTGAYLVGSGTVHAKG